MNKSHCILYFLISFFYANGHLWGFQTSNQPLFELIPPDLTNVDFNNILEDTEEHNIMIYSNYYGGAGVGIGDINNDGLPDLYFAGNLVPDQLYLNRGNLEFENITTSAGILDNGGWSSGVIMADVNQDGWLDIYVTRELYDDQPELRRNKLYINNQDNTFTEQAAVYNIDNDERTRHATFLDYDKDGDLDLFLLNQPPNPGDYSKFYKTELILPEYKAVLYQNEGSNFTDVTEEAGLGRTGFPNSVTASDINGDGWTDLFVANDFWVGDWYYINNGDGTFTDHVLEKLPHTSFSSMGVDAADINNDGRLDIGVVDMVAEDNYRQKANMSGMNPAAFWKVVNDGGHYQYMFNMLHLNKGSGHLADIAQLAGIASTDWSWSILMADWDNDGWKDIHITNGLMRDIRNKDASKTLPDFLEAALHEFIQKNPNPENVGIWDIVDINEALSLVPSEKLHNYAFRNNGDLTFTKMIDEWGFDQKTFSNGSAYADLDNDGDLDLVVNNINDPASIYRNTASDRKLANFLRIVPVADRENVVIDGVKVKVKWKGNEQFQEITGVRGMYSTSEKIAHFGLGELDMVEEVKVIWPDSKVNVYSQVKANQRIKAFYSNAINNNSNAIVDDTKIFNPVNEGHLINHIHQENPYDDYKTQVLLPHKMSSFGPLLSAGDVNGDGAMDLFIGGSATKKASLYLQSGAGEYILSHQKAIEQDSMHEDIGSVFFDADGDGDMDLYVVSGGNEFMPGTKRYRDRFYRNNGKGNFEAAPSAIPDLKISGSKVLAEDFDKDGDIDLFVAGRHQPFSYPEPVSSSLLLNDGEGKFSDSTQELAPGLINLGMVNDAKWSDQNGDGWKDLILVGEWMPVTVFYNEKGQLSKADLPALDQTAGWWFSVETEDMDGDGDEDIIAGNLGLNYKYKATQEEPFGVYYYDFDDNNKKDIVLTYYNFGIEYPLRGRQCSSEQVPEIKKKFETYDLFASSDVAEIYGENKLENALSYEAETFASMYFENLGNGGYSTHPLPVEAQISSINDFIIHDFNRDGHPDILLAGNLYDAEVETARNDAGHGLLLLGDGKGQFSPVDQTESGFFIPADVKSMKLVEVKGHQYVLMGCNHGPLKTFHLNTTQLQK
ncbi:VCBS repeat-containing protein [Portibacter marinus]|uniref:VCBS repeat-containing protein n=1 Tax=Portibacter marinus TaxID=2898660 RepID=UPI001F274845|nr:VCBS repeat-containing protein [Portibacter marinus]